MCASRRKIALSFIPNRLNYYAESTVHTDLHMWQGAVQYNLTSCRFETNDLNFETPLKSRFSIIRLKLEISVFHFNSLPDKNIHLQFARTYKYDHVKHLNVYFVNFMLSAGRSLNEYSFRQHTI